MGEFLPKHGRQLQLGAQINFWVIFRIRQGFSQHNFSCQQFPDLPVLVISLNSVSILCIRVKQTDLCWLSQGIGRKFPPNSHPPEDPASSKQLVPPPAPSVATAHGVFPLPHSRFFLQAVPLSNAQEVFKHSSSPQDCYIPN